MPKPDLLRDNELIYGRLLPVDEPHLIERYNKALVAFGLKPTKLNPSRSTAPASRLRSPRNSATTSISIPTRSTAASSS